MRPRPPRGLHQFLGGRIERAQILLMPANALIDKRVQLEVDLIESRGEANSQASTVAPRLHAIGEPDRDPELHQARRTRVDPILRKPKVAADAISCFQQRRRQGSAGSSASACRRAATSTSRVGWLISPKASSAEPPTMTSS